MGDGMEEASTLGDPRPVKLTVDDFAVLHDAGALAAHGRVELIEGVIVEMSPQQRPHSFAKNELTYRLRRALEEIGSPYTAQSEPTVAIDRHNAPEPEIVVTNAPRGDGYTPVGSIALVIEVAATTLRYDLSSKRRLYADAGLPEYWVIDVHARQIHQFWAVNEGTYAQTRIVPLGGELRSATMADLAIDGRGIL